MTKTRPSKRKRFLVAPFQYRLVLASFVYIASSILVFTGALFAPLVLELRSETSTLEQRTEAANQFLSLHARLWPAFIVLVLLLSLHSVLVSHRIAGPLVQFQRIFEAVAAGNFSVRARVRQRDFLVKEASSINRMLDTFSARIQSAEQGTEKLLSIVASLRRATASGSLDAISRNVGEMESSIDELKRNLSAPGIEANTERAG
jgi:methyl-accepting chemotaxis protein